MPLWAKGATCSLIEFGKQGFMAGLLGDRALAWVGGGKHWHHAAQHRQDNPQVLLGVEAF